MDRMRPPRRAEMPVHKAPKVSAPAGAELYPITTTISGFVRLTGISRSKIYELLAASEIEAIRIGARRLVVIDSYLRLVERKRELGRTPGAKDDRS